MMKTLEEAKIFRTNNLIALHTTITFKETLCIENRSTRATCLSITAI